MSYEETVLSVTAIVVTLGFLWSVVRQNQSDKEADLRARQSVAAQSFFEGCGLNGARLNEVLQWLRTESMNCLFEASKSEFSEVACRRGVIELFDQRVIEQIANSRYRLSIADIARDMFFDMMKPVMDVRILIRGDQKVQKSIYSVVAAKPVTKMLDAVIVDASARMGKPVESVRNVIALEVSIQRLQTSEQNKLGFGPMTIGS